MRQRLHGKLGWVGIGLIAGSLFGGVAVARVLIPAHSVSWNSLTKGLQKRISQPQTPGAVGPKGDTGATGATGPRGPAGVVIEPPEEPGPPEDFSSPRAYGWVAPFDEEEELKRSSNASLVEPEGDPAGIWCIDLEGVDPANALVQLTPVEEPHVATEEVLPEVPVVRWQTSPLHCDEDQIEIETALYKGGGQNVPTDIPFTFLIEEAG